MKLERGTVSSSQMLYMVVAFLQHAALTVTFSFTLTKQSTWIVLLIVFALTVPVVLMYLAIAGRYPDKNLIQINDAVFGKYLGKLISAIYVWYFFQLAIHHTYFFNSFWINYIMPETPREALLIPMAIACGLAVLGGIEAIARTSLTFAVIVWMTTITLATLLLGEMDTSYLLPIVNASFKDFVQSTHVMLTIPFLDLVLFLMIFPYAKNKEKLKKPVLIGLSLCVLQTLIVVLRDIMVLGPALANVTSPSFAAAREIDIADILTRMDILVAVSLLATVSYKVMICYYVVVLGTAQIFNLHSYKHLIIPVGAFGIMICLVLYPSDMEQVYGALYAWPFNAIITQLLLPLITFATIGIQKLAGRIKEIQT